MAFDSSAVRLHDARWRYGSGSPAGSVTPLGDGTTPELYQDTATSKIYIATGATNTDWSKIAIGTDDWKTISDASPIFSTTDADSWSFTQRIIRYKVIGDVVHYIARLQATPTIGSANGLLQVPLPVNGALYSKYDFLTNWGTASPGASMPASTDRIAAQVNVTNNTFRFYAFGSNTVAPVALASSNFPTGQEIYFQWSGFYEFDG